MEEKQIKCVVWDLDGTLWDGILLESDEVQLRPGIKDIIRSLDSRGILNSIASKNECEYAIEKLRFFGMEEYFLYPEICWSAKSDSVYKIQQHLNIGIDTIMFIDDSQFERDEVQHSHPQVRCFDAADTANLLQLSCVNPTMLTADSSKRRQLYQQDFERKKQAEDYVGPRADFLKSLNIQFSITQACEEDLRRAEELTLRTNQLNTTGKTYDYAELKELSESPTHQVLISELSDKYGGHGKIGLALIEMEQQCWHLRLFLMSCRVMSYGVGTAFLSHIMQQAKQQGKKLRAYFKQTGKNRMTYITFKFANFKEIAKDDEGHLVLENDISNIQQIPPYIDITIH